MDCCHGRLEVKGPRELKFFPGVARGGVYPGFQYMSEAGAVAAPIAQCAGQPEAADTGSVRDTTGPSSSQQQSDLASASSASGPDVHPGLLAGSECFYDYSNGGPRFDEEAAANGEIPGSQECRVLATYCDLGNAAAAVACRVGRGKAVLCGTHPELATHWLGTADQPVDSDAARQLQCISNAATVKGKLEQTQAQRQRFWLYLLQECGLL